MHYFLICSPVKVVRAKITEEVNNRLVQVGVDPLKSRLNQNVFQKQKSHLQQQLEIKSKVINIEIPRRVYRIRRIV